MSDRYLRAVWLDLETRRQGHLENARGFAIEAERVRATRDFPENPLYALEHQREVDQRVEYLTGSAALAEREAERTLTEQRGIEHSMRDQGNERSRERGRRTER